MAIQLSEHFTFKKLLKFVYPSIVMMIFTSIYSVVDGLFVSNFVGKTALAAINLILPFVMGLREQAEAQSLQKHSEKRKVRRQTNISR